jgi:MFS family permease
MAVAALLVLVLAPAFGLLLARRRTPAGTVEATETAGFAGRHWTRREAVRTPLALALVPGFLTPSFVGTALIFQQVHLAGLKGWTLAAMAPAYSLYAAVTVTVALVSGWAADRFGPARLLPAFALPLGLSALVLGAFGGLWAWYAGLALMALSFGVTNVLWNALLARLCGTRHLGSTRAAAVATMVVASALGPGVTGLLIDAGIAFTAQCMAMGLWCLALAAAYVPLAARLAGAEAAVTPAPARP